MLWPRSLFGRITFIFSGMMILSYIAAIVLFLIFFVKPISISTATYLSQQVISIQMALRGMNEAQKQTYLTSLALQENVYLYSNKYPGLLPGSKANNVFQNGIEQELKNRIDQDLQVRFQFEDTRRVVWLNFDNDKTVNWLGVLLSEEGNQFPKSLKAQLVIILLLTILGSALIAYWLNRPIKKLVNAAKLIGHGEFPEPLRLQGPKELQELSETFNSMASDINKLAEDRNLMLAGVSHDLRTPLARMRLAAEMLGDKVDIELQQGMVNDLEDMDRILSQFIAYTRDDVDEQLQATDLNMLIRDLAENYSHQDKTLKLDLADKLPEIKIKPTAMRRLLINLIDNAWHYAKPPVEIHSRLIDQSVHICIKDRGTGIDQSKIEKLCEPFARLDESRSEGLRSGLGLAIVKRIAAAHEAKLEFSNREGGGLNICLVLSI